MSADAVRALAAAILAVTVALEAGAIAMTAGVAPLAEVVLYAVCAVAQAIAGLLVVQRHPRHPIGWVLLLLALQTASWGDATLAYGRRAVVEGWPAGSYAEAIASVSWIVGGLGLVLLFLLFPSGRPPSRRWRLVLWVWAAGALLAAPGWLLNPRLAGELAGGTNPFAVDGFPAEPAFVVGAGLVSGSLVASIVALLRRFRASTGLERQQLKWVVLAGAVMAVVLPASAALWTLWHPVQLLAAASLTFLPIAASIALLRHHLYDVDLVISRTVSYAALTGLLAVGYAVVVLAVGAVVASPLAAAAGALVVAVAFRPVRDRIQDAVDRRFRPARHRTRSELAGFVDRLRQGAATADEVEQVLRRAIGDDRLEVVFRTAAGRTYDVHGRARAWAPAEGREDTRAVPGGVVRHRPEDGALVAEALDAGRLALEIAALQVELRRQLDELDASRARIVAVADEERRRLARDLHDGAQQRLVAIGLGLRHLQHTLRTGPQSTTEIDTALDGAVAELATAIDDLRELAGGLRPASLDAGLASALHELASRSPVPVDVRAGVEQVPGELEAAAYFIACEGVTNAVKHAHASRVALEVEHRDGTVVLTVADDGVGGAAPGAGTGLRGLADRVRAHGGTLAVDSPPGHGTRLVARLPCG